MCCCTKRWRRSFAKDIKPFFKKNGAEFSLKKQGFRSTPKSRTSTSSSTKSPTSQKGPNAKQSERPNSRNSSELYKHTKNSSKGTNDTRGQANSRKTLMTRKKTNNKKTKTKVAQDTHQPNATKPTNSSSNKSAPSQHKSAKRCNSTGQHLSRNKSNPKSIPKSNNNSKASSRVYRAHARYARSKTKKGSTCMRSWKWVIPWLRAWSTWSMRGRLAGAGRWGRGGMRVMMCLRMRRIKKRNGLLITWNSSGSPGAHRWTSRASPATAS